MAETREFSGDLLELAVQSGVPLNRAMRRGKFGEAYSLKGQNGLELIGVPAASPKFFGWIQDSRQRGTRRKRK